MKLSISNIAWSVEHDEYMYSFLDSSGFRGLEIAPTRMFPNKPYERLDEARLFAEALKNKYGLTVSSIQSIWYGRNENIFTNRENRTVLIDYTKKAIDFAVAIGCRNLVFGCPKNRNIPDALDKDEAFEIAHKFFSAIGAYADSHGVVIALEANPSIYNTNFINLTEEAFAFIDGVKGLAVNVDLGTIIENNEDLSIIADNLERISHIHISEPNLEKIVERNIHHKLYEILTAYAYSKYVSIEMKNLNDINIVKSVVNLIHNIFGVIL